MRRLQSWIVALATLALAASARAQVAMPGRDGYGPVTPETVAASIENTAREISERYPGRTVSRHAMIDMAWPTEGDEDTGGYLVVLVTAQSHVAAELPVRRVYVRSADGREIELQRISSRTVAAPAGLANSLFGPYREDSFYWAPMDVMVAPGDVLIDFASGRTGFRVQSLPVAAPPNYHGAPATQPNIAALNVILHREYVGFDAPPQSSTL